VQHRAKRSHEGDTWSLPGGARASTETAHEAALREAAEEAGVAAGDVRLAHSWIEDHGTWSYTTVVGHVAEPVNARATSWESAELRWVGLDDVPRLELHPAFAAAWPELREHAERRLTLVVDAANVVGSRPDGWWHDRFGATERLRDSLAPIARSGLPAASFGLPGLVWWPEIRLVVEGAARAVPSIPGVDVTPAERDGDSRIVEVVAGVVAERPDDHVVAVTADRALRERVTSAGGTSRGPGALRSVIP
jgi:ADP-ribose pyrophosphatase YjhB (NUDIX family)